MSTLKVTCYICSKSCLKEDCPICIWCSKRYTSFICNKHCVYLNLGGEYLSTCCVNCESDIKEQFRNENNKILEYGKLFHFDEEIDKVEKLNAIVKGY